MSEFQEWMRANASALGPKPLSEVFLPGTHDTGAYALSLDTILSDSQLEQVARSTASSFFGGMIVKWIETQEHDITGQLDLGIRFLDFRLSPQNASQTSDPVIWISHTVACVQLSEALQQVDSWLSQHPSEVVLVRLTRDWEHRAYWTPEHNVKAWEVVRDTVGRHMLPSGARQGSGAGGLLPTYNEIMAAGKPLVVFWEMELPASPVGEEVHAACYGAPGFTDTLWPEKAKPDENLAGMIELVKQRQQQAGYKPGAPTPESSDGGDGSGKAGWKLFQRYNYLAYAATPGMDTLSCLGNFGLKALAERSEELLPQLLDIDLTGCPAITVDYPSEPLVRAIVAQNKF